MTSECENATKGQKLPTEEGAKLAVDSAEGILQKILPEVSSLTLLYLLGDAVASLRHYVTEGTGGISWESPFVQLQYDAELEGAGPLRDLADKYPDGMTPEDVETLRNELLRSVASPRFPVALFRELTRDVVIVLTPKATRPGRRPSKNLEADAPPEGRILAPPEIGKELAALVEPERGARLSELAAGAFIPELLPLSGTVTTEKGAEDFACTLAFGIAPLHYNLKTGRAFFLIGIGLDFTKGDPSTWPAGEQEAFWDSLVKAIDDETQAQLKALEDKAPAEKLERPGKTEPSKAASIRKEIFFDAKTYTYSIYKLAGIKGGAHLLQQFYKPQTPLNWAVGLVLFSFTDREKVKAGDWQEVAIKDLQDRVFCLTERDAPRHGQQREDILAEIVKLHTTRTPYYRTKTVRQGRAWRKETALGSYVAIPEIEFVHYDKKTRKRVLPSDPALRDFRIPLEIKGRRALKPDGSDIPALPKGRWRIDTFRWRWVQTFNEDLLVLTALEESGKRKGLPKKNTKGKPLRLGSRTPVSNNIFGALQTLRAEGSGSVYAHRLLIMLAHNLNKTEDGIAADRLFGMLGITEDHTKTTHEKAEDLVLRAVWRLKQIGALLPGSDEYPRTDPNRARRVRPYYRLIRAPEYRPMDLGIYSVIEAEEEALAIQGVLPGIDPPVPSGAEIRAARKAAGLTLRAFARLVDGPDFSVWSRYERGKTGERTPRRIAPDVWQRVSDFVAKHGPKGNPGGE